MSCLPYGLSIVIEYFSSKLLLGPLMPIFFWAPLETLGKKKDPIAPVPIAGQTT